MKTPRIAIDWGLDQASVMHGQYRYAVDLIAALASLDLPAEFIVCGIRSEPAPEIARVFVDKAGQWQYRFKPVHRFRGARYWHLLRDFAWLRRERPDLLHSIDSTIPAGAPCPTVWTCYDLMVERFDEYQSARCSRVYARTRRSVCERAARILAISECTARDLSHFWHVEPARIQTVYLGTNLSHWQAAAAPSGTKALSDLPYLCSPYNLEPRKNLSGLLKALAIVRRRHSHVRLVLFGRAAWSAERETDFERQLHELELQDTVVRTGFIDDSALADLYRHSWITVFPSLYEGFGLPVLEAMACGTAVIARANTSMAEVLADSGVLLETADREALAAAIVGLLEAPEERHRLAQLALRRGALFTCERMARETFQVYQSVLNSHQSHG